MGATDIPLSILSTRTKDRDQQSLKSNQHYTEVGLRVTRLSLSLFIPPSLPLSLSLSLGVLLSAFQQKNSCTVYQTH